MSYAAAKLEANQLKCARSLVLLAAVLGAWWHGLRPVRAQSCHDIPAQAAENEVFRASASTLIGSYDTQGRKGDYIGLRASASYVNPWVIGTVTVPYYRLTRDSAVTRGLGDVASSLRVTAYRNTTAHFAGGVEYAMTFPSGTASDGLGMGHYMLMPGAWARVELGKVMLLGRLGYGRRLGGMSMPQMAGHHMAVSPVPVVDPMNESELTHTLAVAYEVHAMLDAQARLWGASPVGPQDGVTREMVAAGAQLNLGHVDVGAEVQVPLVGSPFRYRTVLTVGGHW